MSIFRGHCAKGDLDKVWAIGTSLQFSRACFLLPGTRARVRFRCSVGLVCICISPVNQNDLTEPCPTALALEWVQTPNPKQNRLQMFFFSVSGVSSLLFPNAECSSSEFLWVISCHCFGRSWQYIRGISPAPKQSISAFKTTALSTLAWDWNTQKDQSLESFGVPVFLHPSYAYANLFSLLEYLTYENAHLSWSFSIILIIPSTHCTHARFIFLQMCTDSQISCAYHIIIHHKFVIHHIWCLISFCHDLSCRIILL